MAEEEVISQTTFTFVVLHRTEDLPPSIEFALRESEDGHAVGQVINTVTVPVAGDRVERMLLRMGNDGTFFDEDLAENRTPAGRLVKQLDAGELDDVLDTISSLVGKRRRALNARSKRKQAGDPSSSLNEFKLALEQYNGLTTAAKDAPMQEKAQVAAETMHHLRWIQRNAAFAALTAPEAELVVGLIKATALRVCTELMGLLPERSERLAEQFVSP